MMSKQVPEETVSSADVQEWLRVRKAEHPLDPGIPRRIRLDLMCPAELAITRAKREVESMPASTLLTEATILLSDARDKVADFVDAQDGVNKNAG
jgi:hypothetical protein